MNTVLEQQVIRRWPRRKLHFLAKRLKKPAQHCFYLILALALGLGTWLGLSRSSYFALDRIEVVGNLQALTAEDIERAAQIPVGTNLFRIALAAVEQNILKQRWVESVSIRRQIPNVLWISIQEYQPKALRLDGKLFFVSQEGKVFKEVEGETKRDFVVLTGAQNESSILEALRLIAFFEKKVDFGVFGLSEIYYNEATGFSLVTLNGAMEVTLGKENLETKLERLMTVWSYLQPRLGGFSGIDLDYEDRAFVKL